MEKEIKTYKHMWKMICFRGWTYFFNGIIWTGIHLMPLVPGIIAQKFFNFVSGESSIKGGLWGIFIIMIFSTIANLILIMLGARLDIYQRFSMGSLLRKNMIKSILKQPGASPKKYSSGEILNSIKEDASQIESSISWSLDLIGNTIFAVIALYILLDINVTMTIFVFTPLIGVVIIAQAVSEKIEKYRRLSRKATGEVVGAIGEIFTYIQTVKAAGAEENLFKRVEELSKNRHKMMLKDSLFTQFMNSIFYNTVNIGTGLILLLGAQSIQSNSFTVGDFALFVYYLNFVADFTHFFGNFLAMYKQCGVAFRRMISLVDENNPDSITEYSKVYIKEELVEEFAVDIEREELNALKVENLTYLYPSTKKGIENVSFQLKKGSFTVITGKIGSGKTTLVRTLLGLLPSDTGKIYWNEKEIDNPEKFFIPPHSAYTAQVPSLFSDTVKNNILLGIEEDDKAIEKAIHTAVLEEDILSLENGLETIIGPRGMKLSGGQIQRVSAARMLIRDAELYVFDDISSALDVNTEKFLWSRLSEKSEAACLLVSNRKWALQHADNIIVLKDGKVEAEGKLEDLLENCEEMRSIWGA